MKPSDTSAEAKKHPILAVRRAGVPLAAFETSDPAQTISNAVRAMTKAADVPLLRWDCVRGLVGINGKGQSLTNAIIAKHGAGAEQDTTVDPQFTLNLLRKGGDACANALCFFMSAHRFIANDQVAQAMWNLRDEWKTQGSTLVLLCPALKLPEDLTHDIVVISEPLPDGVEIGNIVDTIAKDAHLGKIDDREKVVDTLLGISAFAAEQAFAMSLSQDPENKDKVVLNRAELWDRKRKMVEQTPGLSVFRDSASFDDIGGLDNIKNFLTRILNSGNNPVRCIGFIDEIEKMFGGSAGDTSGVSQDQLKVFLTEMQDSNIPGIILIGPPGTGKSAIAKGAGAVADAEVLTIDTGAMTGSLVGESQAKIRHAMSTFKAVSQGKGLFIATCNKIAALPPELRRRFTLGTFYVDLPTDAERKTIWPLWLKKYKLDAKQERPDDSGWTGAEIKACCDVAFRANMSLKEAASFIVPVSKSAADQIDNLRRQASGKFISASKSEIYTYEQPEAEQPKEPKQGRKFGQ